MKKIMFLFFMLCSVSANSMPSLQAPSSVIDGVGTVKRSKSSVLMAGAEAEHKCVCEQIIEYIFE